MKVEILKNKNGEDFYPLSHTKSTYNDNGESLDDLLNNKSTVSVNDTVSEDTPFATSITIDGVVYRLGGGSGKTLNTHIASNSILTTYEKV